MEANAAGVGATGTLPANPGMDASYQMQPRTRNQRSQALHEFKRGHHNMRGAVLVGRLELQHGIAGAIALSRSLAKAGRVM